MNSTFRDYDTFSDEESVVAEYNMRLKDLQDLGGIGAELKVQKLNSEVVLGINLSYYLPYLFQTFLTFF